MFDHIGIEVRDLEKSKKFYEVALASLGVKLLIDLKEYHTAGFGPNRPQFWISSEEPKRASNEIHLCFNAKTRAHVRAFYEAAIAAGGQDNGFPSLRPEYDENYYGAYVLDLDGNNLEACCRSPE